MLTGYTLRYNNSKLSIEDFREQFLIPLCGIEASFKVLEVFHYQIFSVNNNRLARSILIQYDFDGREYLSFTEEGIYLKAYCKYLDKTFDVNIVECRCVTSQSH